MAKITSEPMRPGTLTLAQARKIVDAMVEYASVTKPGRGMAFAVVDEAGVLKYFARMEGATLNNRRMAENKAWTAIVWGRDTRGIKDMLKEAGQDIAWFGDVDRMTTIPGGNLLRAKEGYIIGAVGTSGRHEDIDEELALVGVKAYDPSL